MNLLSDSCYLASSCIRTDSASSWRAEEGTRLALTSWIWPEFGSFQRVLCSPPLGRASRDVWRMGGACPFSDKVWRYDNCSNAGFMDEGRGAICSPQIFFIYFNYLLQQKPSRQRSAYATKIANLPHHLTPFVNTWGALWAGGWFVRPQCFISYANYI